MGSADKATNSYPVLAPRFWHGMPSKIWFPLVWKNRFRIGLTRAHIATGVSCFMPISDVLAAIQHLIYGHQIARTGLVGDPIFVLGHWRSGTTLLHEYLGLDDRYASPTTFQCFAPWNFLLTEGTVTQFGGFLLPEKRPMDNMKAGWALPQEDEFALMNLGAPTPYLRLAFPRNGFVFENTLDGALFSSDELREWKRLFDWFMRALTFKMRKQLILKSPPHTGRIGTLRAMYPNAKFVHIVRDPRKLFPSTVNLWKSLDHVQGLQEGADESELESFVFRCLNTMYTAFERDSVGLDDSQIIHIGYERLIQEPFETMEKVYLQLGLGDFEPIRERLKTKLQQDKEFRPNRFTMDPDLEARILENWRDYAVRYGYSAG